MKRKNIIGKTFFLAREIDEFNFRIEIKENFAPDKFIGFGVNLAKLMNQINFFQVKISH